MKERPYLVLWALSAFLCLLPFALAKPGLPMALGPGEATQLAMAQSLAHDADLRCDLGDLERLYGEVPFGGSVQLALAGEEGWSGARFDAALPYPLLAAPLVALFGANGLLLLNLCAACLCLWLGSLCLAREQSSGMALFFVLGFLPLSATFLLAFRLRPEIFVAACLLAAHTLLWRRDRPGLARAAGAGACLGLAAAQDPLWALAALPLLATLLLGGRPRPALVAVAAGSLVALLLTLLGLALGAPTAAAERAMWTVEDPTSLPWAQSEEPPAGPRAESHGLAPRGIVEGSVGRHTGLLPYFPFLLIVLWHLLRSRPGREEVLLALGLAALLLGFGFLLPLETGSVGNPRLAPLYPLLLLLVGPVRPLATLAGYALGALFLGMAWLTPLGSPVPRSTAPTHARNPPFMALPLETRLLPRLPDYSRQAAGQGAGLWFHAADGEEVGEELWLLGGQASELWLESPEPLGEAIFRLRSQAPEQRVALRLGESGQALDFAEVPPEGETRQVRLSPGAPHGRTADGTYLYRLRLEAERGEQPRWRREGSPRSFYLGAALAFLGAAETLERDLYAVTWESCAAPAVVAPGAELLVLTRLTNASPYPWPSLGAARVRLSYVWRDGGEAEPARDGRRTELSEDLLPGETLSAWVRVVAPTRPGPHQLELDAIYEGVSWFSLRNGGQVCRAEVEVREPEAGE